MNFEKLKHHIGNKVKMLRTFAKIGQEELGFDVGVSTETISNIERAKVLPTILTLEKIAEKFSIDITEFFQFERNDVKSKERMEMEEKILYEVKNMSDKELAFMLMVVDGVKGLG